jgi:hypothetical protein
MTVVFTMTRYLARHLSHRLSHHLSRHIRHHRLALLSARLTVWCCALVAAFLLTLQAAQAAELLPYHVQYSATYNKLQADAERRLVKTDTSAEWQLQSKVELKLLGRTVSTIEEISAFDWRNEQPLSVSYRYQQKGLGSRSRSADFDNNAEQVNFTVNDKSNSLPLAATTFDSLNHQLVLAQALAKGADTVEVLVADRGELKTYQYQVLDKEPLTTAQGVFASVHIERVRDAENARQTEFWLASDFAFVLLKLEQQEPDGDKLLLELREGQVGDKPLQGQR